MVLLHYAFTLELVNFAELPSKSKKRYVLRNKNKRAGTPKAQGTFITVPRNIRVSRNPG